MNAGSWEPEIISDLGIVPVDATLDKYTIQYTLTSISPTEDLNVLGNDNLTISGTNFPSDIGQNDIVIEFSDAT
jgi:hypothetical protein